MTLSAIARRVPAGKSLPPSLSDVAAFVKLRTKDARALTHEALAPSLVPFVVLGDGGVVALWYTNAAEPPVVWVSSDGEHRVVARDVADFVARLGARKTNVPELDEDPKLVRSPVRRGSLPSLSKLQKSFAAAVAAAAPPSDDTVDGAALCEELVRATGALVAKGYFGPQDRRLKSWSVRCRAQKLGGAWRLEDARPTKTGEFAYQPTQHEALVRAWPKLLGLVKDPRRAAYELVIYDHGPARGISIDRGRQLELSGRSR
jgi:hypothetical protein